MLSILLSTAAAASSQAAAISAGRSLPDVCCFCNDGMNWDKNRP